MKLTILKLSTLFLFLLFIGASCQNDEDLFEMQVGDENAVIQEEVNGIEFKFCLLNEQGEPATVFNEGENFAFLLAIQNNTDTTLYYDVSVLNSNGFCEVMDNQSSEGVPYQKPVFINLIGKVAWGIPKGYSRSDTIKWIPSSDIWEDGFVAYRKGNSTFLSSGIYHTEFSHRFDFETKKTEKLTFKINFEIK